MKIRNYLNYRLVEVSEIKTIDIVSKTLFQRLLVTAFLLNEVNGIEEELCGSLEND